MFGGEGRVQGLGAFSGARGEFCDPAFRLLRVPRVLNQVAQLAPTAVTHGSARLLSDRVLTSHQRFQASSPSSYVSFKLLRKGLRAPASLRVSEGTAARLSPGKGPAGGLTCVSCSRGTCHVLGTPPLPAVCQLGPGRPLHMWLQAGARSAFDVLHPAIC